MTQKRPVVSPPLMARWVAACTENESTGFPASANGTGHATKEEAAQVQAASSQDP
jgi:hypothetical protein